MPEPVVTSAQQPTAKRKNAIYVTHSAVQLIAWPILLYLYVISFFFLLVIDIPISYIEIWSMQQIGTLVNVVIAFIWWAVDRTTARCHIKAVGTIFIANSIGAAVICLLYMSLR